MKTGFSMVKRKLRDGSVSTVFELHVHKKEEEKAVIEFLTDHTRGIKIGELTGAFISSSSYFSGLPQGLLYLVDSKIPKRHKEGAITFIFSGERPSR